MICKMRNIKSLLVTVLLALSMTVDAQGQLMDFGTVQTIHQETREGAGIGSFSLEREGNPENRSEWTARVDAFGLGGELLANLEIRWPEAETTDVIITMGATGRSYRYVGHEGVADMWLEFEDHEKGESFSIRRVKADRKREIYRSEEEVNEAIAKRRHETQSEMQVQGSRKSAEELLSSYQDVLKIISMAVLEVQTVLGIAPQQEKAKLSGRTNGSDLIFCPEGSPFCDFSQIALGEGDVLFGGKTACCTEASQDADVTCRIHTQQGCCANSFCTVTSLICFGYCACLVRGHLWGCQAPCT